MRLIPLASGEVIPASGEKTFNFSAKVFNRLIFQEDGVAETLMKITVSIGSKVLCNGVLLRDLRRLTQFYNGGLEIPALGVVASFNPGHRYLETNEQVDITITNLDAFNATELDMIAETDNYESPTPKVLSKILDTNLSRTNVKRLFLLGQDGVTSQDEVVKTIDLVSDSSSMIAKVKEYWLRSALAQVNFASLGDFCVVFDADIPENITVNFPDLNLTTQYFVCQQMDSDVSYLQSQMRLYNEYVAKYVRSINKESLQTARIIGA